jgi:hypothetical protein
MIFISNISTNSARTNRTRKNDESIKTDLIKKKKHFIFRLKIESQSQQQSLIVESLRKLKIIQRIEIDEMMKRINNVS